jgi:hypothetical protein
MRRILLTLSRQIAPAFDEITDVGGACAGKPALLRPAPNARETCDDASY